MNLPLNTYRIQFNKDFTFKDLKEIIPYLENLGIDCIYASPVFKAVPGSNHGYDITDPHHINPEVGVYSELVNLKNELSKKNIKWIQDIVPNHMAYHPENFWLMDVLEKKKESEYFNFFDINWQHPYYKHKLMAPILAEPLEDAISANKIKLKLTDEGINICYYDNVFPASITSYKYILEAANYLKRKILSIINRDEEIQENLDRFTQNKKLLNEFLELQNFRLVHWQETDQTINYRRFFTINGLICLKMEEESVFNNYHKFIFRQIRDGIFDGLRIDHIDGLLDPTTYLTRLRRAIGKTTPVLVEKILEPQEMLPGNWQVQGTTGYDFLANVNRLLTDNSKAGKLKKVYFNFTNANDDYDNIVFENKLNFLKKYMGGELSNLHFLQKEIMPEADKETLAIMLAAMPVYRLYPTQKGITEHDRKIIDQSADTAKQYAGNEKVDKVSSLLKNGDGDQWLYFMQRFQQLSGPLAAKGIEDTTFYQYNSLISHNEVGNNPEFYDYSPETFTLYLKERNKCFKDTINTTSTHDTKRGEDARMRINVISEQPEIWERHVIKFKEINKKLKNNSIPDNNDEFFLYQTIIGSLPIDGKVDESYIDRLKSYMIKVTREGKINSDWAEPNEAYEKHLKHFIDKIFENDTFKSAVKEYLLFSSFYGSLNSISQLVLKFTVPGIADVYQGNELWNFSFVDPDNRLKVDYKFRNELMGSMKDYTPDNLFNLFNQNYNSPEVKLFFTTKLLRLRLQYNELFQEGSFETLEIMGSKKENVYSFHRTYEDQEVIVTCGRLFTNIYHGLNLADEKWEGLSVKVINSGIYQDLFSGKEITISNDVPVKGLFLTFPISVLIKK